MLPSLAPGSQRPSILSALKNALTQPSGSPAAESPSPGPQAAPSSSLNLKGLYNLVLGPKPSGAGISGPASPQEPHLIGQRPVLNQFQDPLSASLNRMRLILPVGESGGAVTRDAPSLTPPPSTQQKQLAPSALQLELPREDRSERQHQAQHQQRIQEYQLAQMPLESQRHAAREKEDVVLDATGRPIMRRGHSESFFAKVGRGLGAALALSFSFLRALLGLFTLILPLRIRSKLPNQQETPQTPRMRAPRG